MNRENLRRLDMNLLIVFEMVLRERNVTRASKNLFTSQSAVSSSLAKLRDLFGDPLFIRSGEFMEPTSRALDIAQLLTPALDGMMSALSSKQIFDPASSRQVFRIGMSDDVEFGLMPQLLAYMGAHAPNVSLVIRRADFREMPRMLLSNEVSLGVSHTDELPANSKRRRLRATRPVVLSAMRASTPLSLKEYCARPHVLVSFNGDLNGYMDTELAKLGLTRNVMLALPQFSSMASILTGTNMLATVPDYVASRMVEVCDLHAEPLPLEVAGHDVSLTWSGASDSSPAEQWLRGAILEVMSE